MRAAPALAAGLLWAAPVLATFARTPGPWGDLARPLGLALLVGLGGAALVGLALESAAAGGLVLGAAALGFWELEHALQLVQPLPTPALFWGLVACVVATLVGLPRLGRALAARPRLGQGTVLAMGLLGLGQVGMALPGLVSRPGVPAPGTAPWAPASRVGPGAEDVLVVLLDDLRPGDLDGLVGAAPDGTAGWPSADEGLMAMLASGRLAAWFGVQGYRTRLVRAGPVGLRGAGFEEVVEGGPSLLEHRLVAGSALGLLRLDLQVSALRVQLAGGLAALPTPADLEDRRPTFTVAHVLAPAPPYVMPDDGEVPAESLLTVWDLGEEPAGDVRRARSRHLGWVRGQLEALRTRVAASGRSTRLVVAGDRPGLRMRIAVPAP